MEVDSNGRQYYMNHQVWDAFRLMSKPFDIIVDGIELEEVRTEDAEGWTWQALSIGGVLKINQAKGHQIEIKL